MVCISVFTPLSVSADDFSVSDGILTKYNGPGGNVNIPDNVQKIGGSAFQDCEKVTSVSIPEGCFAIEDGAFDGCINMKTVSLPNTLTSIGTLAFARCKSLEYVHLPSGLETIKGGAFYDCEKLGSVRIPSGTKTVENGCFSNCDSLILLETDPSNSSFIAVDNVLYTSDRSISRKSFFHPLFVKFAKKLSQDAHPSHLWICPRTYRKYTSSLSGTAQICAEYMCIIRISRRLRQRSAAIHPLSFTVMTILGFIHTLKSTIFVSERWIKTFMINRILR